MKMIICELSPMAQSRQCFAYKRIHIYGMKTDTKVPFCVFRTLMKARCVCIDRVDGRHPSSVCLNIEIRIRIKLLIIWIFCCCFHIFVIPSVCLQRIWLGKVFDFNVLADMTRLLGRNEQKKNEMKCDTIFSLLPWTARGVITSTFL